MLELYTHCAVKVSRHLAAYRTLPPPRAGGAAFVRFFGQGASYAWVDADEEHLVTFVADDEPLCAATQVKKALRSKWRRAIQEAKEASEASKGLEL